MWVWSGYLIILQLLVAGALVGGHAAPPLSYDDIVVGVVTSSAVHADRLPQIARAWVARAPFAVHIFSDVSTSCHGHSDGSTKDCLPTLRCEHCTKDKSGLACKTQCLFTKLHEIYGHRKKWFLRAMDDTLLVPLNVKRVLSRFDWQQPWYLGDMEDLEDESGVASQVSGKGTFQVGPSMSQSCWCNISGRLQAADADGC
jgi:hypothetical protein